MYLCSMCSGANNGGGGHENKNDIKYSYNGQIKCHVTSEFGYLIMKDSILDDYSGFIKNQF